MLGVVLFAVHLLLEFIIDFFLGRVTVEPFVSLLFGLILWIMWLNLSESDESAMVEVSAVLVILAFYFIKYLLEF